MGAISGLLGTAGGANGSGFQAPSSAVTFGNGTTQASATQAAQAALGSKAQQDQLLAALQNQGALNAQQLGTKFTGDAAANLGQNEGIASQARAYKETNALNNQLEGANGVGNLGNVQNQATGLSGQLAGNQGVSNQNAGFQGLANTAGRYEDVASGRGPNPAQAMLNQQTGNNIAQQAALMAGQRGAGANVGLLARQAAQQGAATQQQAVGQGATMQAQQSLNALSGLTAAQQAAANVAQQQVGNQQSQQQLASGIAQQQINSQLAGNQALAGVAQQQVGNQLAANQAFNQQGNTLTGQQIAQTNQNTQLAQQQQNIEQQGINAQNASNVGMQSNINSANAGLISSQMKGQTGMIGGIMNGIGGAMGNIGGSGSGGSSGGGGGGAAGAAGGASAGTRRSAPGSDGPATAPSSTSSSTGATGAVDTAPSSNPSSNPQEMPYNAARGGMIHEMAGGGYADTAGATQAGAPTANPIAVPVAQTGPSSSFGQFLKDVGGGMSGDEDSNKGFGGAGMSSLVGSAVGGVGSLFSRGASSSNVNARAGADGEAMGSNHKASSLAKGGAVKNLENGGGVNASEQKQKAVQSGNSYSNDKIPALLSEGEVVIPRSVMQSKDPARGSAMFVAKVLAKKRGK